MRSYWLTKRVCPRIFLYIPVRQLAYEYAGDERPFTYWPNQLMIIDEKGKLDANEFVKFFLDKYQYKLLGWKPMKKTNAWREWVWNRDIQQDLIKELESNFDVVTRKMVSDCIFFLTRTWEDKDIIWYLNNINEYWIHLLDGIYDVVKNKFEPYTDKQMMKVKNFLPYSHKNVSWWGNPKLFISFLNSVFQWEPDINNNIKFIQEFMWLLLIPNSKFEKALFILWTWGNGKSTLFDTIRNMLWEQNCSSVWLNELMDKQMTYNLIWKLCNIDQDIFYRAFLDKPIVKKIVSWENIVAKPMYLQPVEFKPFSRIVCASNTMPTIKHVDKSIIRRFIFLEFKNSFVADPDIDLKQKLKDEKYKIFAWAFKWLTRLLKNWKFTISSQIILNEKKFLWL